MDGQARRSCAPPLTAHALRWLELDELDALISQAAALCPVSGLFTGAKVSVQAQLLDATRDAAA